MTGDGTRSNSSAVGDAGCLSAGTDSIRGASADGTGFGAGANPACGAETAGASGWLGAGARLVCGGNTAGGSCPGSAGSSTGFPLVGRAVSGATVAGTTTAT